MSNNKAKLSNEKLLKEVDKIVKLQNERIENLEAWSQVIANHLNNFSTVVNKLGSQLKGLEKTIIGLDLIQKKDKVELTELHLEASTNLNSLAKLVGKISPQPQYSNNALQLTNLCQNQNQN